MIIYKKNAVCGKGVLVTLFRYVGNGEEQPIIFRFNPGKIDGHAIRKGGRKCRTGVKMK